MRRLLANAVQNWKIENCLEEIKAHKMSIGKAAEECGISVWGILEILKEKNIDWIGYGKEDLEKDLEFLG